LWAASAVLLAIVWASVAHAAPASPQRTILVLGDSLSAGYGIKVEQGWVTLLTRRLQSKGYGYRVVNASVSGETTSGGVNRLPRALALHKPDIVVLELGGNDGLRGLPIATSRNNLVRMIEMSQKAGAKVLMVGMMIPPNYGPRYSAEFQGMFGDLAKRYGLRLVPFFLNFVALDPKLMQADGIHPNAAGQPQLLENLWPELEPLLVKSSSARPPAAAAKTRAAP
jgi:acyl-CoA thioesterase I